jgi:hypothetical protein
VKLLVRYDGTHLIPSSRDSVEAWEKLRSGQEYRLEIKQARNPQFHRLAFGLIQAMYHSQERFENFEDFRRELKILTGHYDEYITVKGETVYIPKSWAFSQMDEIEFHEVYERIKDIAVKRFGTEFVGQIEQAA